MPCKGVSPLPLDGVHYGYMDVAYVVGKDRHKGVDSL